MKIDLKQFAPENLAKDSLYTGSVDMDWQPSANEPDAWERIRVIHPEITESVLDEHGEGWREHFAGEEYDSDEDRLTAAIDEFPCSDAYHEWIDSYYPIMNYAYPVTLRHNADLPSLATKIEAMAGCVTLVEVDEQCYLALTGGGMDLSWNICAAFIACNLMPPLKYLDGLPAMHNAESIQTNLPQGVAQLVLDCMPVAADCLRHLADRLDSAPKRLATH